MSRALYRLFFLWLLLLPLVSGAQQVKLLLHIRDSVLPAPAVVGEVLPAVQSFANLPDAYGYLRKLLPRLQERGFLEASADSVAVTGEGVHATVHIGPVYRWARLSLDRVPAPVLDNAGISLRDYQGQPVSPARIAALSERLLRYCEDNGYPFAVTTFDSVRQTGEGMYAAMVLDRGRLVRIDSLVISGDIDVSRDFLQQYMGIRQGDPYNENQLRLLSKRISELPFLQEARPWEMSFTIAGNRLHLYLKEKKANQLNGLIGLQPNTAQTGRFLLTADVLLGLKNSLGYGESIDATYQNLQYKSPRFHASASVPYLLGTAFGVEASFDLFKRDTTFRRTTFDIGIRYQLNAADYIKVSYQTISNRLITPDTNYVRFNRKLPDNLDVRSRGAAVEFYMDRTDYRLNPRRGWQARVAGSGLLRTVIPNDAITEISDGSGFSYAALYDTANADKYQYRIAGAAGYYLPLMKSLVLKAGYSGGYVSGKRLFLNELFQIGGFRLLRGFDEQSIFASQYHVFTLELRLLLSRNSCFYLFSDNAYTETRYTGVYREDYPVSFGAGITLENKSGIFNVGLGLGKHSGEDFQFRQSRIHFGYTAYF